MTEQPTLDTYRTAYISARWNVNDNCARALQLLEVGYTASAVARALDVTEGTAKKYQRTLEETISPRVTETVTRNKPKFDVFGAFDRSGKTYQDGESDGAAARESAENTQATETKEQIDPAFRERDLPLNKQSIEEIPKNLITISVEV
jgi:hypothetical protein